MMLHLLSKKKNQGIGNDGNTEDVSLMAMADLMMKMTPTVGDSNRRNDSMDRINSSGIIRSLCLVVSWCWILLYSIVANLICFARLSLSRDRSSLNNGGLRRNEFLTCVDMEDDGRKYEHNGEKNSAEEEYQEDEKHVKKRRHRSLGHVLSSEAEVIDFNSHHPAYEHEDDRKVSVDGEPVADDQSGSLQLEEKKRQDSLNKEALIRFLSAEDFMGDYHTEASSSSIMEYDIFSEGSDSRSSFDEDDDDFLTESEFDHHLKKSTKTLGFDLSSSDDEGEINVGWRGFSNENVFDYNYGFLAEGDKVFDGIGAISVDVAGSVSVHGKKDNDKAEEMSISTSPASSIISDYKKSVSPLEAEEIHAEETKRESSGVRRDEGESGGGTIDDEERADENTEHGTVFDSANATENLQHTDVGGRDIPVDLSVDEEENQNRDDATTCSLYDAQEDRNRVSSEREIIEDGLNTSILHLDLNAQEDRQKEEEEPLVIRRRRVSFEAHTKAGDVIDDDEEGNKNDGDNDVDEEKCHMKDDDNAEYDQEISDMLWEHHDLIDQLQSELKKAKAGGLPTISEDMEWPAVMEEVKPIKMMDIPPMKMGRRGREKSPLTELEKFYRSYVERMRKFDVLNYQKMCSLGLIKIKVGDPRKSFSSLKDLAPVLTSTLTSHFPEIKKHAPERSEQFMSGLLDDFERVYVGQVCLSWEFLQWQYLKVVGLIESGVHVSSNLSRVAGEFQKFQVLIMRFLENESFQGPRVVYYVKNRRSIRTLLQIPLIKEEKGNHDVIEGEGATFVNIDQLLEMMEESLRLFWELVRTDKGEAVVPSKKWRLGTEKSEAVPSMKWRLGQQTGLENPDDKKLLMQINESLRKKEKRAKDLQRSNQCLFKRCNKPKPQQQQQHQGPVIDESFFALVDAKLVSRVLKMSKVTSDQLEWCQNKLSNINFVGRKLRRETSFCLFPC